MALNVFYLECLGKNWVWSSFSSKRSQVFGWNLVQSTNWSFDRGPHFTQGSRGNNCIGKHWACSSWETYQSQGFRMFQWVKNAKRIFWIIFTIKLLQFLGIFQYFGDESTLILVMYFPLEDLNQTHNYDPRNSLIMNLEQKQQIPDFLFFRKPITVYS